MPQPRSTHRRQRDSESSNHKPHMSLRNEQFPLEQQIKEIEPKLLKPLEKPDQHRHVAAMKQAFHTLEESLLGNIYIARYAAFLLEKIEVTQSSFELDSKPQGSTQRGKRRAASEDSYDEHMIGGEELSPPVFLNSRESRGFTRHNMRTFAPSIRKVLPLIDEHLQKWEDAYNLSQNKAISATKHSGAQRAVQEHALATIELFRSVGNLRFLREHLFGELEKIAHTIPQKGDSRTQQALARKLCQTLQETPQSFSERLTVARDAHDKAFTAREILLVTNQALVSKVADLVLQSRPYLTTRVEKNDLINEGNLGFIEALERFDLSRGTQLVTYAVWWIRQSMNRAADAANVIRLPSYLQHSSLTSSDEQDTKKPGDKTLKGVLRQEYRYIANKAFHFHSIDQTAGHSEVNNNSPLRDTIRDPLEDDGLSSTDVAELREELFNLMERAKLTDRERFVVCSRFGLEIYNRDEQSLEQVAKVLKITKERVRQIQEIALHKMLRKARTNKNRILAAFLQ